MMDNGMDNGVNKDIDTGFEMEADTEVLNRVELMKLSGKELAKKAAPYSTLKLTTLERKSKAELCDIILNKTDKPHQENEKPHARAARSSSETEQLIDTALNILDALKFNRDDEPIHAGVKETFKKQATIYADKKVNEDAMDINKANTFLLYLTGAAVIYDGIIGFKNTPGLISKIKKKYFTGKKADDTK